jgi:flavin reductase (DIM6/NTAB) family NADH-FMN oxidoreductase RutF
VTADRPVSSPDAVLRDWPAGTAVLTAADRDGWWWGLTATSAVPVSARQPLVAVGLPRVRCRPVFRTATAFAVHVLSVGQEAIAARFAAGSTDFDGLPVECGFADVPLLADVAVRVDCRQERTVRGGDTVFLLGEVLRASTGSGVPLVQLARPA